LEVQSSGPTGLDAGAELRLQGIRLRFLELQDSWDDTLSTALVYLGHPVDLVQVLTTISAAGMHCGGSISGGDGKEASEGHWGSRTNRLHGQIYQAQDLKATTHACIGI